MSIWKYLVLALAWVALIGQTHAEKPHVVASFGIPADWVKQVAGDEVELQVLAGNGQDIHAFEPAPRDLAMLAQADLVVAIGADLEYWLPGMVKASGFKGRVLPLSDVITLHKNNGDEHQHEGHEHEHHESHEHAAHTDHHDHDRHVHGEYDPHIWMDPENVSRMSESLTEALCELDPSSAETFRANQAKWAQRLDELDAYAKKRFSAIPPASRAIITYHDNLSYFAERYDIFIPATILGSTSTDGGEPSARQMAQLIQLIKKDHVAAVFTDPGSNPRLAQQVCREAGLPAPQPLYVGSFARDKNGPQDYEALFIYTVDTIADSMQTPAH
ncbi:metal ABC transporter substrate-binding protein [Ruficoccus sp. ZRK36]|uniref:metal ABC transporter substrate-binding protein n=1 Tax=Ruficoccus sp. ZRK36 TaxID=2866311 RepID=UPI001C72CC44|nr:metal ABC transporter substrate-binding protein [Ruficoccus sp. ZRK36]QYY36198.1 metal ABC transporter substrate-binding protein [Ruficoccus sp. ZRK36]